jgi:hypothetical protein
MVLIRFIDPASAKIASAGVGASTDGAVEKRLA